MATHTEGNYSRGKPVKHLRAGDTITGGNYSQLNPGTDVFAGVEEVTVEGGNFVNCAKPASWTIKGGNWAQISRCSHVHPEWVAKGLEPCDEDCEHRVGDTQQWVPVSEKDYREEKNSLEATKAEVRTINETDADGIITQRLEKQAYVYADAVSAAAAREATK